MAEKDVQYIIGALDVSKEANDSAIANLKRVDAQSVTTTQKMQSQWESVRSAYAMASAGIAGGIYIVNKALAEMREAWNLAEAGAAYEEQLGMLDGLAGSFGATAQSMMASMKEASEGLISNADLAKTALGGLAKGMDPAQMIQLAGVAHVLGETVGKESSEAFEDLSKALESGRERQLKMYLGAQDLERVMSQCTSTANEHEKMQYRLAAVMQHAATIQAQLGNETATADEKMKQFSIIVQNTTTWLGEKMVSAGLAAVGMFQWLAAGALTAAAAVQKLTIPMGMLSDWTGRTKGQADYNRKQAEMLQGAAAELAGKAAENFKLAFGQIEPVVKAKVQIAGGDYDSEAARAKQKAEREKAAREALHIQEEQFRQALRLYNEDQQAFAAAQKGKISAANTMTQATINDARWTFDHSAQTYDDELALIATMRASKIDSAQVEQAAIVAMIENYGRSQDKQSEIAGLRTQWSQAYQAELGAEKESVLAVMDMEQRRLEQYVQQVAEMNEQYNQTMEGAKQDMFSKAGIDSDQQAFMDAYLGNDPFSIQKQAQDDFYNYNLEHLEQYQASYLQKMGTFLSQSEAKQKLSADHEQAIIKLASQQKLYAYSAGLSAMGAAAGSLYAALGEKGKAFFYLQQGLAVAQALVSAYLCSQLAYQSQMAIPTPDAPARAAAAAAIALKFGLFNAAMVAATAIGNIASSSGSGGGSGAGSGGSSGSSSASAAVSTETAAVTEEKSKSYTINVHYYGHVYGVSADALARDLLPAIRKAEADGV